MIHLDDNQNLYNFTFVDSVLRIADGAFTHTTIGYGNTKNKKDDDKIISRFRFDKLLRGTDEINEFIKNEIENNNPFWNKVRYGINSDVKIGPKKNPRANIIFFLDDNHEAFKYIDFNLPKANIFIIFYGQKEIFLKSKVFLEKSPKILNSAIDLYKLFYHFEGLVRHEDPLLFMDSFANDGDILKYWNYNQKPTLLRQFFKYLRSKEIIIDFGGENV
jgi:hypothetical protein